MNNKKHTDTDKKIKFWVFYEQECMAHGLTSGSNITAYKAYKIFGLYKYNPKLSHWKNFCNRWKWPFPHKKLENVIMDRGDKVGMVLMVLFNWI
ncbi:MAG: hypothetical protein LBV22_00015 [Mycoplasmataceae bacterium]|jgi:hypothetical protein|nr:hypothetical protein [Mycoplasmataceae bacterium]